MLHHTFVQSTGLFILANPYAKFYGYSGDKDHFNNPDAENLIRQGPLPCGFYDIGVPYTHPRLGYLTMNLTAWKPLYDRSGFRIHGDNADLNHTASEGCIVLNHSARSSIANSNIRVLAVIRN